MYNAHCYEIFDIKFERVQANNIQRQHQVRENKIYTHNLLENVIKMYV